MDQQAVLKIITELENQIHLLIQKNSVLQAKANELEATLHQKQTKKDIFDHLDTNDRISMKAKVEHLIHKIDQHLQKSEANS
jgi:hypothetical protein